MKGRISVPGDKSISHRALMIGAIARGDTHITGFLNGADCLSTMNCLRAMGVKIDHEEGSSDVTVHGVGLDGLRESASVLDCGNSGTTTRILSGLLTGQCFYSTLTGDDSIRKRPMKRIIDPLTLMGAKISSKEGNGCAPLSIEPSALHGITYDMPVSSAQVKSCLLMAGLYADSDVKITEPSLSRDHTERMLRAFGADLVSSDPTEGGRPWCLLHPGRDLVSSDVSVPGDISSAAYFIGAALITPDSDLLIENVGINPARAGILKVFSDMGADIVLENKRVVTGEEVADIHVRYSALHGCEICGDVIPTLIDEIPLIAVVATRATGCTIIRDAAELKVKESDRIALMTKGLSDMGADIRATDDGFVINEGGDPVQLKGTLIEDAHDHRIAMSFAVASLVASSETVIAHPECVSISYPGFFEDLGRLSKA